MSEEIKKTVLLLCDDLLFGSRVGGEVRAQGGACRQARSVEKFLELAGQPGMIAAAIDLDTAGDRIGEIMGVWGAGRPAAAYGSHVEVEKLKRAAEAGCSPVLPRSRFTTSLSQIALSWLNNSC